MENLTISFIKSLKSRIPFTKEAYFGDSVLKGFGLRAQGKSLTYVFKYRNQFKQQRTYTIGSAFNLAPEEARNIAKQLFAKVSNGEDPAHDKQSNRKAITVAELCDWYMQEGTSHKKASTLAIDAGRIRNHIKPLIGKEPVKNVTRGIVEKMMLDIINGKGITVKQASDKPRGVTNVTGGNTAASRTVQLLGAIFTFAEHRGIITGNPAHGIKKPKSNVKDVFLDIDDIKVLGSILNSDKYQTLHKSAVDAIKLILLTGCRKNEILTLKWEYVDLPNQCFHFPDTKTGKQIRPFGVGALQLLKELETHKSSVWVFPASSGKNHYQGLPRTFAALLKTNKEESSEPLLPKTGVTIHTLRHTFASIGADMGYTEFTLAGLLGHKKRGTVTNRYSHAVDKSLIAAADCISLRINNALEGKDPASAEIINIAKGKGA